MPVVAEIAEKNLRTDFFRHNPEFELKLGQSGLDNYIKEYVMM